MTQLVFVHGVATRSGPTYDQAVKNRDSLFRKVLFEDPGLSIHNPLWGDLVPAIAKDVYNTNAGVGTFSILGAPVGAGAGLGGAIRGGGSTEGRGPSLADVARAKPNVALDALFTELLDEYDAKGMAIPPDQLEAFARVANAMAADERAAQSAAVAPDGVSALVGSAATDIDLVKAVRASAGGPASMGIGSALAEAARGLTDRIRNVISSVAFDPLVDLVRPPVGFFLGDVFTYLHDGDTRAAIRAKVREKLAEAQATRADGEKLVVIGHSLGGVILVDMLCSLAAAELPADLEVDALITVGSQPGLFQALGLFLPLGGDRTPKPACVGTWFNVFDPIDPLAFRADPIFSGVTDLKFDSITGLASAHTTYFKRPQFHARARKRLRDCGVIP